VCEADDQEVRDGSPNEVRDQYQLCGISRTIRPRTAVPFTVLVTELDNGALILQGRSDGPRVYLGQADALPLRRELAAAYGRTECPLPDDQDEAR
jgi:hypothetical protein